MLFLTATINRRGLLRILNPVLLAVLIAGSSVAVTAKMNPMSRSEMSRVSGREGLTIDLGLKSSISNIDYTDADGAANVTGNAGFGRLRLGGGSGQRVVLDNGAGGRVQLTGFTVDADASGGIVFGFPSGQFSLDVPWISVVDSTTGPGNGLSYGQLRIDDVDVKKTVIRTGAADEGFNIDLDLRVEATNVTYTDPDGSSQDASAGNLTLQAVDIGDFNDNSPPTLSGLTVNVDGSGGIVIGAPSTSVLKAEIGDIELAGSSLGRFRADDMNFDGSQLFIDAPGSGEGIDGKFNLQYTADYWELTDRDGWNGSGNGANLIEFNGLKIGNDPWGTLGASTVNFSTHTDADRGIVLQTDDTNQTMDVLMDDLELAGSEVGEVRFDGLEIGHNQYEIQPTGSGLEIDMDLSVSVDDELRITDEDGDASNGEAGVSLGRTEDGVAIMDESGGEKADLNNLTLDVDPTNGLVVNAPSGHVDVNLRDIYSGVPDGSGGTWDSFGGIYAEWIELDKSRFEISGHGDGLDIDGAIHADIDRIQFIDGTGAGGSGFSNTPGSFDLCDWGSDCMTFGDGNGNAVSFSDLRFNADGSDGVVVEAPSIPSYQLELDDVNVDDQQTLLEPVRINNLNPAGSSLKVQPR